MPLTQVTIWRLDSAPLAPSDSALRPQRAADAPELERLYQRTTPVPVQRLEMGLAPNQPDEDRISPILSNPHHVHISGYVLDDDRGCGLAGCVQILWGKRGAWIRLWTDTNNPNTHNARLLLGFALQRIYEAPHFHRAYISVRAYQTGLNALLSDYGFAPFTDRMLMVRNILQWRRRPVDQRMPALEAVQEAVPGSLAIPKFDCRRLPLLDTWRQSNRFRRLPLLDTWRQSNRFRRLPLLDTWRQSNRFRRLHLLDTWRRSNSAPPAPSAALPVADSRNAGARQRPISWRQSNADGLQRAQTSASPRAIAMRRPASRPRRPARGGIDTIVNHYLQTTVLVIYRALAGLLKTKNQKLPNDPTHNR